jgi:hypothetical protein
MTLDCPHGHGAYETPALRCPRCGAPLVERAARRPGDRGRPVQVAVAPNEPIAGLWRSVLEESGIVTMIRPLGPGFGAWGSVATFEHEVLVPEADAADARALLADFAADDDDAEVAFPEDGDEA